MARSAGASFDPPTASPDVRLALPNGYTRFDRVDQFAAGHEGFLTVRGGRPDPHGEIPGHETAGRVHSGSPHPVLERDFPDKPATLLFGQLPVSLVIESGHFPPFVVVTHPTFEKNKSPAILGSQLPAQRRRVDRMICEPEHYGLILRRRAPERQPGPRFAVGVRQARTHR